MAGSLLIPMSVTAKVVTQPIHPPSLNGAPFNRDADVLKPGVHLHWALPDALTNARILNDIADPTNPGSTHPVIFPGLPDLWVVVRLDPLPPLIPAKFKRSWMAWVVDSRAGSMTTLDKWQPNKTPNGSSVHTVAGMLTSAAAVKYPGWGIYDQKKPFDIASAAYYPEARQRFGLYDPIAVPAAGRVTYIVAGWYSNRDQDPLYNSKERQKLLERWGISTGTRSETIHELVSSIAIDPTKVAADWKLSSPLTLTQMPAPSANRLDAAIRSAARGGIREERAAQLDNMSQSLPISVTAVKDIGVTVTPQKGPAEIICHGSVIEVPLTGGAALPPLTTDQIQLFPSVTRAMAAIACAQADSVTIDQVEMLLDNADQQRGTIGGILDYPGIAHERNFQGVPGKPKRYARIEVAPLTRRARARSIDATTQSLAGGRKASGYFPNPELRMAQVHQIIYSVNVPPNLVQVAQPQLPAGPSPAEIRNWIRDFLAAFSQAIVDSANRGTPIDVRLIRVQDHRSKAHPPAIGRSVDGSGPQQAGYWLEVDLKKAQAALAADPTKDPSLIQDPTVRLLREFYEGAVGTSISLHHFSNLYELPGPRWYRPWSPQIVISKAGRSYRFGEDNRFGGALMARLSGETVSALRIGKFAPITGREIMIDGSPLSATPSVPPEVRSLVEETMLHDSDCGGVMAAQGSANATVYQKAIQATWLMRNPDLSASDRVALGAVQPIGVFPSPVAITPWKDPTDPLFVDVKYAHPFSQLEDKWTLLPDHVDLTPKGKDNAATQPTPGSVKTFDDFPVPPGPPPGERARLTASICKVLDSSLVSKTTVSPQGFQTKAQKPPASIDEDTFTKLDLLSAALTHFDDNVYASGLRQRSGALRLNHIDLVDVYGVARHWDSPTVPDNSPVGDDKLSYWTQLTPRLPYWSRVQHRLMSADDSSIEAAGSEHAICGFLLPDFVEHSLEVLDGDGSPIGEITSVFPQGPKAAVVPNGLAVEFHVHPWLGLKDDLLSIENETLRAVVGGIAAQSRDIPATTPTNSSDIFESGLTAFLRVVDTIRSTLDPTVTNPNTGIHLMGEPIVVVKTTLSIEATAPENRTKLYGDPPPIGGPLPKVRVRIGDVTRPDDGVLGLFVPPDALNPKPQFVPVSPDAVHKAVINGLTVGVPYLQKAADDPFLADRPSELDVFVGAPPLPLIVLMDTRGGIYTTSGVLPRKKVTLPVDQLKAAMAGLEASFRTGPILAVPNRGVAKVTIPAIDLKGYETSFIRKKPDLTFEELPVPDTPPLGELPQDRVLLCTGWLRVKRREPGQN